MAEFFLPAFLTARETEEILADLEELRLHRARTQGRVRASLWFWFELLRGAPVLRFNRSTFMASRRGVVRDAPSAGATDFVDSVFRDLRVAVRSFSRTPGVSLVAVATIALGIGATTAIFSFANALLLKPLPVRDPGQLVGVLHRSTVAQDRYSSFSFPDFQDLREETETLAGLAAFSSTNMRLGPTSASEVVEGLIVSGNYFSVLGGEIMAGRGFVTEEDVTPGSHPVVVLSHGLWTRRFGGDLSVLGRDVVVNGHDFTVVGIAAPSMPTLNLKNAPQLWVPLQMHEVIIPDFSMQGRSLFESRGSHWLALVGRLRDGVDRPAAERSLQSVAAWQAETFPETNGDWTVALVSADEAKAGVPGNRPLVGITALLAVVVGLVLLIASANVANILLARAVSRRQEMAVRLSIGAGRTRLIRQVLTETLLLSAVGGTLGVLLAALAMRLIPLLGVTAGYPGLQVSLDLRVMAFAAVVSLVTGAAFGLIPALRATGQGLVRWSRGGGQFQTGRGLSFRQGLMALQIAFSLVLLIGAGLALRTLWNLDTLPLGFEIERLRVVEIDLADREGGLSGELTEEAGLDFFRETLERASTLPGVEAAALSWSSPFSSRRMANDVFWQEGASDDEQSRINVDMNIVGPGYFETMGIPMVRGRSFTPEDRAGSADVVVVNQTTADRFWPRQDPIGKRIWSWDPTGDHRELQVVGVVPDGRYYRSWRAASRLFVFVPLAQNYRDRAFLHVRETAESSPSPELLRNLVAELDPELPPVEARTVQGLKEAALGLERTNAKLLGLFGLLAMLIASIGVYGVVSFSVSQRTHEIGIRMALGASAPDVRRSVIGGSLRPLLIGTTVGWFTALGLGRFASAFLFGVQPWDALTYGFAALLLGAVGLVASFVPARRATQVDPIMALQEE